MEYRESCSDPYRKISHTATINKVQGRAAEFIAPWREKNSK